MLPDLEEWRPVVGYEEFYEVSSHGRMRLLVERFGTGRRMLVTPRLVTPKRHGKGYLGFDLSRNGKKRRVGLHVIVLTAFVGPAPAGMEAAHGDGIRTHNWLSNLRWATRSSNHLDKRRHGTSFQGERHPLHRLTEAAVREIRAQAHRGNHQTLADKYGVSRSLVSQVARKEIWSHVA